jgi:RNA polymerase sigma-70 factor (family 1)
VKVVRESETDELAWLRLLKQDNVRGFDALFRHYSSRLYRFAYTYLRDRAASEEIVQDCFLKIWERRATLRDDVSLKGYLFTIAHNAILNQIRQQHRHQQYEHGIRQTDPSEAVPGNAVEYAELEQLYLDALDKLPPKRRQVFVMSRQQGLSYAEIARELNLSVKTVETQIAQALKFLDSYMRLHGVRMVWPLLVWLLS